MKFAAWLLLASAAAAEDEFAQILRNSVDIRASHKTNDKTLDAAFALGPAKKLLHEYLRQGDARRAQQWRGAAQAVSPAERTHVMLSTDAAHFRGLVACIASCIDAAGANAGRITFTVVVPPEHTIDAKKRIECAIGNATSLGTEVVVVGTPPRHNEKIASSHQWIARRGHLESPSNYVRFHLPIFFGPEVTRVLYLDGASADHWSLPVFRKRVSGMSRIITRRGED